MTRHRCTREQRGQASQETRRTSQNRRSVTAALPSRRVHHIFHGEGRPLYCTTSNQPTNNLLQHKLQLLLCTLHDSHRLHREGCVHPSLTSRCAAAFCPCLCSCRRRGSVGLRCLCQLVAEARHHPAHTTTTKGGTGPHTGIQQC